MSVKRNTPEMTALLKEMEGKLNLRPCVHEDFIKLRDLIFHLTKRHISETTLERVWGYSIRTVENLSLHTVNLLCLAIGYSDWEDFLNSLCNRDPRESDMFDVDGISSGDLSPGDTLTIGWLPNRHCKVRYLGDNRFIADECVNSKLNKGDTFSCLRFELGMPLFLENLISADGKINGKRYGAALKNGLTVLQLHKG